MANKYCNLDGSKKIKDEFKKINDGFDKVQEDLKDIIVTPAKGVSEQEIIQARKGKDTLNDRLNDTDSRVSSDKVELNTRIDNIIATVSSDKVELNTRIDNIIATPTMVSEQEIIDARHGSVSLGANIAALKEDYTTQIAEWLSVLTIEDKVWEVI